MSNRLDGRAAIVTGAGDGVGRGIAIRLARAGASVLVADINEEAGESTAQAVRDAGGRAGFLSCDVTIRTDVKRMVEACLGTYGAVDILVNNAYSGSPAARVESMDDARFEHQFRISFFAAKWAMTEAFPHMRLRNWGRIINLCSLNGVNAHMGSADYNTGKEALRAFTRTAAREWAPHGICANILCPASTSAAFRRFADRQPVLAAAARDANPMGRIGDPEADIGGVAVFLASEDARYLTGNTLFVDGGAHISGVPWSPDLPD